MTTAFVLINCESGSETELVKSLSKTNEIKEIQSTIGSYDMLVKVVSPTAHGLRKIITERIINQEKVRGTQVLIRTHQTCELR